MRPVNGSVRFERFQRGAIAKSSRGLGDGKASENSDSDAPSSGRSVTLYGFQHGAIAKSSRRPELGDGRASENSEAPSPGRSIA